MDRPEQTAGGGGVFGAFLASQWIPEITSSNVEYPIRIQLN